MVPTSAAGQQGPVAGLISAAGWATATARVVGRAWIVTPAGPVGPDDLSRLAAAPTRAPAPDRGWRRRLPTVAKTAVKDCRELRRARRFQIATAGPWQDGDVAFVWQRHELFHTAGLALARGLGVPSVLFVPAPLVWQSDGWGVRRPGWRRLAEQVGDARSLRAADLVACGSEAVAAEVRRLGAMPERILVTPTGVDVDRFAPLPGDAGHAARDAVRARFGLDGRFVIGWVGSFRRFHALEQLVAAAARVPGAALLLVGDGPERAGIEHLAATAGVAAACTGTVAHDEVPALLGAMDVAAVVSRPRAPFHYSPVKLAEYLAAGVPVVAPAAGQLPELLRDGEDVVLFEPGDTAALAATFDDLRRDPARRARLAAAGRASAVRSWSWDRQVQRVIDALGALDGRGPHPARPAGAR